MDGLQPQGDYAFAKYNKVPTWQSDMSCGLVISVISVSYRQKCGSDFPFFQAVDGIRYTDEEYNQLLADPVSTSIISNTHWLKSLGASFVLQPALDHLVG